MTPLEGGDEIVGIDEAEAYYDAALTLPLFASMTDHQQDEVVSALSVILNGAKA